MKHTFIGPIAGRVTLRERRRSIVLGMPQVAGTKLNSSIYSVIIVSPKRLRTSWTRDREPRRRESFNWSTTGPMSVEKSQVPYGRTACDLDGLNFIVVYPPGNIVLPTVSLVALDTGPTSGRSASAGTRGWSRQTGRAS